MHSYMHNCACLYIYGRSKDHVRQDEIHQYLCKTLLLLCLQLNKNINLK